MQSTNSATGRPRIELRHVRKQFADVVAIADLSLTVESGEVFVLLGQSGCGKSTALQLINRMLDADGGEVLVDGVDVRGVDPVALRRGIGYVIQQIGLFPHRTVADNVGTVCSLVGWDRARTRTRVAEILDMVGLPPEKFARRYPHQLSGGQQQRVGVARALAVAPPILLMDEPFGALDPQIRRALQQEFRTWVRDLGTTVVFVTHDVDEATTLADRMAVLGDRGRLAQVGRPVDVLGAPVSEEVSEFLGVDRLLKRLSVVPARDAVADPSRRADRRIPADASAYDALLALIDAPDGAVEVEAASGLGGGVVDWPALAALARHD